MLVELVEQVFVHSRCAREDPKELRLVTRVDNRVRIVVGVHDQIVGLVELLTEERDDALAVRLSGTCDASVYAYSRQEAVCE